MRLALESVITDLVPGIGPRVVRTWVEDPTLGKPQPVEITSCDQPIEVRLVADTPTKVELVGDAHCVVDFLKKQVNVAARVVGFPANSKTNPFYMKGVGLERRCSL